MKFIMTSGAISGGGDDRRLDPENLHDNTMRSHVLKQMLDSQASPSGSPRPQPPIPPRDDRVARVVRREVRDEREAMESAVAEHAASTQTFSSLLMGLGAQGAELVVEMPDRQLAGRVVHVGSELVSIENLGGERFDLAMWAIAGVRVAKGQPRPAAVSTGHPNSIIARLREAVTAGEAVTISRRFGAPMAGQVRACGESHVEGVDHNNSFWIVPLTMVTWVGTI